MNCIVMEKSEDRMKRPDHYKCVDCQQRFNDAKFEKVESQGIHSAQATCPNCGSSKIKISWWKRKENR